MPPDAPRLERRWTSRSIGSRLQHLWFYGLIRLGGRRAAYLFLYPVVCWYMLLRPRLRRERTWPYLSRRFPERRPPRLADSRWVPTFYGEPAYHARAIHNGLFGWFGGDGATLHPVAPARRAELLVAGLGGRAAVLVQADEALARGGPMQEGERVGLQFSDLKWFVQDGTLPGGTA